jgi:hypothetical protein
VVDLFGRPIYGDGKRAKQPALFSDRHWFELGYIDAVGDHDAAERVGPAYDYGYQAGRRDVAARTVAVGITASLERAWCQARAVGNVSE